MLPPQVLGISLPAGSNPMPTYTHWGIADRRRRRQVNDNLLVTTCTENHMPIWHLPLDTYNEKAIQDALQRLALRQQVRQYSVVNGTSVLRPEALTSKPPSGLGSTASAGRESRSSSQTAGLSVGQLLLLFLKTHYGIAGQKYRCCHQSRCHKI